MARRTISVALRLVKGRYKPNGTNACTLSSRNLASRENELTFQVHQQLFCAPSHSPISDDCPPKTFQSNLQVHWERDRAQ